VLSVWNKHIEYPGAFLGFNIEGDYPVQAALAELLKGNVVAVANGRAEFGPRALGNRSLLIDPRLPDSKQRMNKFKKREPFRPFAPAILAEFADTYFDMPYATSPYMQYTARCKVPDLVPGAVHIDGTSRVQTVTKQDNPGFRALLEAWYLATGCPILLNTSMNIKGQPLVNDEQDAAAFSKKHKIAVLTKEQQ
jgi:carbamoyltransferase